jgi:cytoskeletal protein CcmA (bactofilin family)
MLTIDELDHINPYNNRDMFGNKKDEKSNNLATAPASTPGGTGAINSIVSGTKIEGTIEAGSDIRIDGELVGTLNCKGRIIIGPQGTVKGDINCVNGVIEGKFSGNLNVKETLNVRETAKIEGDVNTNKLVVQPGALFNVSCNMGNQKIKSFTEKLDKKEPVLEFTGRAK